MPLDPNSSVSVSGAPSELDNAQPLPSPSVDEMNYATQVQTPAQSSSILDSIPSLEQMSAYLANAPQAVQRFLTNPAAFTQLITGSNPLPEQTGFAASTTGLPAQNPNSLITPEGMAYNTGYESGEPIGIAAGAIPALGEAAPVLARAAGERILAGKSLIPGVPSELVNPQIMSAVKEKGGNWAQNSLNQLDQLKQPIREESHVNQIRNDVLDGVQRPESLETALRDNARNGAINNWIDSKLKKYVKNEMGTPQDPVRELADQGITHIQDLGEQPVNPSYTERDFIGNKRAIGNMPRQGFAQTPAGKDWEARSDVAIDQMKAGLINPRSSAIYSPDIGELAAKNPEAVVHALDSSNYRLGFQHLVDELANTVHPNSDLPAYLRLKPETLDKMTVPHAVKHVAKINKYRAEQMAQAAKESLNDFPIVHEGDKGFKIHELKLPEYKPLEGKHVTNKGHFAPYEFHSPEGKVLRREYNPEDLERGLKKDAEQVAYAKLDRALKNEGEQMGHCVGGYTDSVADGSSRIFSLRDDKGGAHATVEIRPHVDSNYNPKNIPDEVKARIDKKAYDETVKVGYPKDSMAWHNHYTGVQIQEGEKYLKQNPKVTNYVEQIKGKGNGAVSEKYRGYIKDWLNKEADKIGHAQDLDNIGVIDLKNGTIRRENLDPKIIKALESGELKRFASREEIKHIMTRPEQPLAKTPEQMRNELFAKSRASEAERKANEPRTLEQRMRDQGLLPPEGHKNGGKIENRPKIDEMRYELARKR